MGTGERKSVMKMVKLYFYSCISFPINIQPKIGFLSANANFRSQSEAKRTLGFISASSSSSSINSSVPFKC